MFCKWLSGLDAPPPDAFVEDTMLPRLFVLVAFEWDVMLFILLLLLVVVDALMDGACGLCLNEEPETATELALDDLNNSFKWLVGRPATTSL